MEVKKYLEFINEARTKKTDIIDDILAFFKEKPLVKMNTVPDEKGIYSLAGLKKAFEVQYKSLAVSQAFDTLLDDKNHKKDIGVVHVDIKQWGKKMPYWYMGLTKEQAEKIKEKYEKENLDKNKEEIEKSAKSKEAASKAAAEKKKKRATPAKRKSTTDKSETATKGVERKPGGKVPAKKRTPAKKRPAHK